MKILMLTLLTCFGATIFGSDTTLFRDEDTGFVMEVPADMQRTWNVSHSQNEIEFTVFANEEDEENPFVIVLGKIPLTDVLGQGSEGLYPFVFEQVKEVIFDLQEDEESISFEVLPSLADEEYGASRMRLCFEDEDETVAIDVHTFLIDTYSYVVAIGVSPTGDSDLDQFTYDVLSTVRFIEEDQE